VLDSLGLKTSEIRDIIKNVTSDNFTDFTVKTRKAKAMGKQARQKEIQKIAKEFEWITKTHDFPIKTIQEMDDSSTQDTRTQETSFTQKDKT